MPATWLALLLSWSSSRARADEPPLSVVADLMATPREQLTTRKPIRIQGIVSSVGDGIASSNSGPPAANSFCIEADSCGIWVRMGAALKEALIDPDAVDLTSLKPGVVVELTGYLDAGLFAPVILPTQIQIIGTQDLPPAKRVVLRTFFSGADDVRRVNINGVVQGITSEGDARWLIRAESGAGHFLVRLPKTEAFAPQRLLDAEVRFLGLAAVSRNWRSELVCPRLIIDHDEDVVIVTPASPNPFDVEKVSIASLDGYKPRGRPLHRRRVEGTLTYNSSGDVMYVQDQDQAVRVESFEPTDAQPGDRVEVSGFIDTTRYIAGLRGAVIRVLDTRETVIALPTTFRNILDEYEQARLDSNRPLRDYDGRLVTVQGRLLSFQKSTSTSPQRLEIDCGDSISTAYLVESMKPLETGTVLRLTGITQLEYARPDESANLAMPVHLDLLLRRAADVVVVQHTSWWTSQRTFNVLCIVGLVALLAVAWAAALQRTVAKQTTQIAHEIRQRRDAAIEFQAAIRERTRLASNLHDTVLQTMTGLAYQLEACDQSDRLTQSQFKSHLATARKMVYYGQDHLRQIVRTLHFLPPSEGQFSDSLKRLVARVSESHDDIKLEVTCDDELPPLADFVAGNLLLVIQEAIHNTTKHAAATRIELRLEFDRHRQLIRLRVRDDGQGFDLNTRRSSSDGHFGMEGMQQRVERLAGTISFVSQPGMGTQILIEIPLKSFDPQVA